MWILAMSAVGASETNWLSILSTGSCEWFKHNTDNCTQPIMINSTSFPLIMNNLKCRWRGDVSKRLTINALPHALLRVSTAGVLRLCATIKSFKGANLLTRLALDGLYWSFLLTSDPARRWKDRSAVKETRYCTVAVGGAGPKPPSVLPAPRDPEL